MKATAVAPANIAFIKYWGKADEALRLPLNSSISMNLDGAYTATTVEFSSGLANDRIALVPIEAFIQQHLEVELSEPAGGFSDAEYRRISAFLDAVRAHTGVRTFARAATANSFPKGAGAAASASGFAALTLAAFASLEFPLTEKELTVFARRGSGSACRSIPGGFVEWVAGDNSETSYAYSLYPPEYWDLRDILVIVNSGMKKVSTSHGMEGVGTSPLLAARMAALPDRIARCRRALAERNFPLLGRVIEEECLDMHRVMQTQVPPLMYWNDGTRRIMEQADRWRREGLEVYYTIDAGPNVHLICEGKDEEKVVQAVKAMKTVKAESIIVNKPAKGAHLVERHVF